MGISPCFTIAILSMLVSFLAGGAVQTRSPSQELAVEQVSRSIKGGYYYVGSVFPVVTTKWEGDCFKNNEAYVTYNSDYSWGTVVITVSDARSHTCYDKYEFKIGDQVIATDYYFFSLYPHKVDFDSSDPQKRSYVKQHGVAVYLYRSGTNGVSNEEEMTNLKPLASSVWGENANTESLNKQMGVAIEDRSRPWLSKVDIDEMTSSY